MNIKTTDPEALSRGSAYPLREQAAAVATLGALADMFGHLPGGYITIHTGAAQDVYVGLQLDAVADFELWRTALQTSPHTVRLHAFKGSVWLSVDAVFCGVRVALTGYGVPLSFEAASVEQALAADVAMTS